MTTISVDYRLAPEHPYPAAFHDCLKVTEYVIQHHKQLGVDPNKVVVGGDNSGGECRCSLRGIAWSYFLHAYSTHDSLNYFTTLRTT